MMVIIRRHLARKHSTNYKCAKEGCDKTFAKQYQVILRYWFWCRDIEVLILRYIEILTLTLTLESININLFFSLTPTWNSTCTDLVTCVENSSRGSKTLTFTWWECTAWQKMTWLHWDDEIVSRIGETVRGSRIYSESHILGTKGQTKCTLAKRSMLHDD